MSISLDEEIKAMVPKPSVVKSRYNEKLCIVKSINDGLNLIKRKDLAAFAHGSTATGLADENDSIDICITSTRPNTPLSKVCVDEYGRIKPLYSMDDLYTDLRLMKFHTVTLYESVANPYCIAKCSLSGIISDISLDNILDIERTNLINEYLNLDTRVKPFLFALKKFTKAKGINDEKSGYLGSYAFTMMGLYFLMFGQDPPVIPCLHSLPNRGPCKDPACRSKSQEKAQGFSTRYHTCVYIDFKKEKYSINNLYPQPHSSIWESENSKEVGQLVQDGFNWFASTVNILKPKSIKSKDNSQCLFKWRNQAVVFTDVFDYTRNIADSCTAIGAVAISKEFAQAYLKLKEGSSFSDVLNVHDRIPRPISTKYYHYTSGRRM